jgi:deazaflavin-dependent oxidoreductase (nitroreductase family)
MRRAVNVLVSGLVRAGLGGRSTYLLTTLGRKSGLERTTPVTILEIDGQRWLVSPYGQVGWVHNARAHPEVTLRSGRGRSRMLAQEVDAGTAGPVLRHYVRRVRVTAPFFDAKPTDEVALFTAEAGRHPVFRLSDSTPGNG